MPVPRNQESDTSRADAECPSSSHRDNFSSERNGFMTCIYRPRFSVEVRLHPLETAKNQTSTGCYNHNEIRAVPDHLPEEDRRVYRSERTPGTAALFGKVARLPRSFLTIGPFLGE